jgi:dTMP kinase
VVLITIEGLDGAGKTTLATALGEKLGATVLREPGGVELSERIRALVTDPALEVDARAEALLYAAARAQLVAERIEPLLQQGETLVLDRFVDSSLAYQGAGRGLGVEQVRAMNDFGIAPDVTFLLRLAPEEAKARRAGPQDRLEREPDAFFAAIAAAYDALAAAEPERFRVLDATLPPDQVLTAALQALPET